MNVNVLFARDRPAKLFELLRVVLQMVRQIDVVVLPHNARIGPAGFREPDQCVELLRQRSVSDLRDVDFPTLLFVRLLIKLTRIIKNDEPGRVLGREALRNEIRDCVREQLASPKCRADGCEDHLLGVLIP